MENDETVSTTYDQMRYCYSVAEPTGADEKLEYDRMRAERRERSKATIIGLFSNAKKNLWELRTISGLDDELGALELYRDYFCDALTSLGVTSDDDYSRLLSHMNGYSDVGCFLYDEKDQRAELAAFGLILYERLTLAKTEKISFTDFFYMHEDLAQCLSYITVEESVSARARTAANARHAKNRADKTKVFDWCDMNMSNFSSMDDAALDIAETFIPQKFRAVREWMTEWKKLRSAGTP